MAGYIGSKAAVVSSGAERKKTFDITTSTTSLTGLSYTVGQVHVFHNGVRLVDGTDYTATNSTSITLTAAAENGDQVVVVSYATFQVADAYTKTEADAEFVAKAGDTMTGGLTVGGSFTSLGIDDNATSTAVTIDASGRVTMPYQPAFEAYSNNTPSFTSSFWVPANATNVNIGNHYNTSAYAFTAPVTGTYLFSISLSGNGGTGGDDSQFLSIGKNGSWPTNATGAAPATNYKYHTRNGVELIQTVVRVMNLTQGDYVQGRLQDVQSNFILSGCVFSGYLIG